MAATRKSRAHRQTTQLGLSQRAAAISLLRETELDVLVIGGGIVGVGAALDATTRGLVTGLVEARDWGSGTSSRSSKLVHGGIRYLEQLNFRLVREALLERGLLMQRIAPHLVKPIRFLYPLTKPIIERLYVGFGMLLYDLFARTGQQAPGVGRHRHLTREQLRQSMPSLRGSKFIGGLSYWDAQVDDARYVATLARTAAGYGAHVASQLEVIGFLKVAERVVGVTVRDHMSQETFEIRARQVVNATGVWTDETQALVGERGQFKVRASKGVHLVVPRDRFHATMGLLLRTEKSVLFVIPWGRHWLIGTTDTDWNLDKAHPAATERDIEYLLSRVNQVLKVPLTRADIEGVYAGLRPLLAGESDETSKLSREHIVAHAAPGLVVVAGGKWTTYRIMAKDAIDAAVHALEGRWSASVTDQIPLTGAEGYRAMWNSRTAFAAQSGLHVSRIERLLNRYGTDTQLILDLIAQRPALAQVLPGAEDYLAAEAVFATTHEGALHLDDVLVRRTHVAMETWDRGVSAAPVVAELMAQELGWTAVQRDAELLAYEQRVAAELASQRERSDEGADRVRRSAETVRSVV